MGTWYQVKVVTDRRPSSAQQSALGERILNTLDEIDRSMSTYREDSLVSRFNRAEPATEIELDAATAQVVALALEISEQTGGAFDVTVGPLVRAWGFGPDPTQGPPSADQLGELRVRVGWRHLELEGKGLSKRVAGLEIDLSAIAKGFAVDSVLAAVTGFELGETQLLGAMVEVGGEVRATGLNREGRAWRIAIESPSVGSRRIHRVVELADLAIATSGDYRNFYEVEGRRYSHIIDPETAEPVTHRTASVSVIHPECAAADAYATALLVMGAEHGLDWARARNLPVSFLVYNDEGGVDELATAAMAERLGIEVGQNGRLLGRAATPAA